MNDIIERFFAAISALSAKDFVACFATNAEINDPVGSPTLRGHAAIGEHFQQITAVFSKVSLRAAKVFPCGRQLAAHWVGQGVGKNGKTVVLEGIDVMELNDAGKIIRLQGYWDPASVVAQATKI